jgi:DNA replication protein DnaC
MDALPDPSREASERVLRQHDAAAEQQAARTAAAAEASKPQTASGLMGFRVDLGHREGHCPSHGPFTSSGWKLATKSASEFWSPCPVCSAERRAQEQAEEAAAIAARQRAARDEAIGSAAVPPRFRDRTFESFSAETPAQAHALSVAQRFASEFPAALRTGAGLVFSGKPGTGKSHLAASVMLALFERHWVRYVTCMGLIRLVRETWRKDSENTEREVLRYFGDQLDLLVIDEIGVQYGTDGEQTVLFEVLDRRYSGMRPTILLTNQDREGFQAYVGERVLDRLRETSRWVAFDWPSYRGQGRAS